MALDLVALGGAVDLKREKPPIGGSAYGLVDWDTRSILLTDFGSYPLSLEEKERQSAVVLSLEEKVPKYTEIAGRKIPVLPKIGPAFFSKDQENYLTPAKTDPFFPRCEILGEMERIYVIGTHAHADHIGGLVYLRKRYPQAQIFMTEPTLKLCMWSWRDSLKIARREGLGVFFTGWDVYDMAKSVTLVEQSCDLELGPFRVRLNRSGHILGGVNVLVSVKHLGGPRVFFTSDTSFEEQHTVAGAVLPHGVVDYVVSESTYAGKSGLSRKAVEDAFAHDVRACLDGSGKVLCPALAIGRSLELYAILEKHGITELFDVFVDGAACQTAEIYTAFGAVTDSIRKSFVKRRREREAVIQRQGPAVIIAPSGMLAGGRAVEHALHLAADPKNLIAFSSYQDPCSPGFRLLRLPIGQRVVFCEQPVEFNARVAEYKLSAHMNGDELLRMIDALKPECTFLVHGEERGMDSVISQSSRRVEKLFLNEPRQLA